MKFILLIYVKMPTIVGILTFISMINTTSEGLNQLSMKSILLIYVKMPTVVGILTFISMINTTSERLKARNFFICQYFSFYEQWNFVLSWVEHEKSFITSEPGFKAVVFIVLDRPMHRQEKVKAICALNLSKFGEKWIAMWHGYKMINTIRHKCGINNY